MKEPRRFLFCLNQNCTWNSRLVVNVDV